MNNETFRKIEEQESKFKLEIYELLSEYFNLRDEHCDPDTSCVNCENCLNTSYLVTENCKCWIESIDKIYNKLRDYELNVDEKDLLELVDQLKTDNAKYLKDYDLQLDTLRELEKSNDNAIEHNKNLDIANENLKETIANQQEQIDALNERLEVKIKEYENAETKITELQTAISRWADIVQDKEDELNELEVKIEQLTNKLNIIVKTCEL